MANPADNIQIQGLIVSHLSPPPCKIGIEKRISKSWFQNIVSQVENAKSQKADMQLVSSNSKLNEHASSKTSTAASSPLSRYFSLAQKATPINLNTMQKATRSMSNSLEECLKSTDHSDLPEYQDQDIYIKATLYPHQKQGLSWLVKQEMGEFKGGILADAMGLGKTVQIIALLMVRREQGVKGTTLIVCAPGLIDQWITEIHTKGDSSLRINVFQGPKRDHQVFEYDVCLCSYGVVGTLPEGKFARVVLDEGHKIRNFESKQAKLCCAIQADYRWVLSGTPLQNSVWDIYSLCLFLRTPKYSLLSFFQHVFGNGKTLTPDEVSHLQAFLPKILLRRSKDTIELPELTIVDKSLKLTPFEMQRYDDILERVKMNMSAQGNSPHIIAWVMLLRGKQACNHFDSVGGSLDDENEGDSGKLALGQETDSLSAHFCKITLEEEEEEEEIVSGTSVCQSTKLDALVKLLVENGAKGEKSIVFSQFLVMLKLIESKLNSIGISTVLYHGSLSATSRERILDQFKKSKTISVFLGSLLCCAEGLNLTVANNVILYDRWYNPSCEQQAISRAYRIGQQKRVIVTRFVVEGTVEEKVVEIQERKRLLYSAASLSDESLKKDLVQSLVSHFKLT